jgi:hypothetical protein
MPKYLHPKNRYAAWKPSKIFIAARLVAQRSAPEPLSDCPEISLQNNG